MARAIGNFGLAGHRHVHLNQFLVSERREFLDRDLTVTCTTTFQGARQMGGEAINGTESVESHYVYRCTH